MLKNKITAALFGIILCVPAVLAPVPKAQAQDIRIYTHTPAPANTSDPTKAPFVVLTLDLSILQLANGGGPLANFFKALGLDNTLNVTSLLSNVGTLVGQTGLTKLGLLKVLLYPLLHNLVGMRLAIVTSYAHTSKVCTSQILGFCVDKESNTTTGAVVLFTTGKSKVLGTDLNGTLNTVVDLGNTIDAIVQSLGTPHYTLGVPFQGKKVYQQLVDYLQGQGTPSAPELTSPRALDTGGYYESPLIASCSGTDIYVINLLLSNPANRDQFANAITKYGYPNGFTHNGIQYYLKSSFLLGGPKTSGVLGLVHNTLGTTNMLLGLTGLGPILGNQIAPAAYSAAKLTKVENYSLAAPQIVQNAIDGSGGQLYLGQFSYHPDDTRRVWSGNLAKLTLNLDSTDPPKLQPFQWPSAVATTNAACNGSDCADVYYQKNENTVTALNLDASTIKALCGANNSRKCDNTYLRADDKLGAAKQIAWARGYQVQRDVLSQSNQYQGLLGFLNGIVGTLQGLLQNTLQAVTGLLFPNAADCQTGSSGSSGGIFGGLVDIIKGVFGLLGGILGIDYQSCQIPTGSVPPARTNMGDILHSRPLAIDYGGDIGVRIFFGTNTGFLHQFSADTKQEVWRFAPRSTMKHFAVWSAGNFEKAHGPYGVDGAPIAYIKNTGGAAIKASEGDKVYLYFGLRRGGKRYYALDVTTPNDGPELKWMIGPSDTGFSNLGFTFSMPAIGKAYGADGQKHMVLVFGGGYDKENDPPAAVGNYHVGSDDSVGTALYVVDASDGSLIKKFKGGASYSIKDSIPSAPSAVDTDGDGDLDYVYVGDTGGRVWRADISAKNPVNWSMKLIADLGRHDQGKVSHDRRFFHAPDVLRLQVDDPDLNENKSGNQPSSKTILAVVIASGNRAAPLKTATNNYLYVLKDSDDIKYPIKPGDLCGTDDNDCDLDSNTKAGWKLELTQPGEKALSSPITFDGTIVFTTYVPYDPSNSSGAVCKPKEGSGRLYAVELDDGEPEKDSDWGGRSKSIHLRGIPGTLQYVGSGRFLARGHIKNKSGKYTVLNVESPRIWRTYWRTRQSEHW